MIEVKARKWSILTLFSLLVVALLGGLMRYKIGYEFPWFSQKYLQHAHSHFAFAGWVSQALMVIMVYFVAFFSDNFRRKVYDRILWTNLILAYGMFFSFAAFGYNGLSIFFSTASILLSFVFIAFFLQDLKRVPEHHPSKNWFRASLAFSFISSAGTFALAFMMATKNIHQNEYLASVYWYLHFQYNGWFFFSCMGIFQNYLLTQFPQYQSNPRVYRAFAYSCIPAMGLSLLWLKIPLLLWIIIFLAAAGQLYGWIIFLMEMKKISFLNLSFRLKGEKYLWLILALAISIKLLLQFGSTFPEISTLAFGFRPVVIAYLHLILLGIISFFLVVVFFARGFLKVNSVSLSGMWIFVAGVYFNEIILAIQGIASFSYTMIPYDRDLLFMASLIIFLGIAMMLAGQNKKEIITS